MAPSTAFCDLANAGGIADDQVEPAPLALVPGERVGDVTHHELVTLGIEPVGAEGLAGERNRVAVEVDAHHPRGAAERGRDREAAGVREAIEGVGPSSGELPDEVTVLALIEEGPGLLPASHVDEELHPVLVDRDPLRRWRPPEDAPLLRRRVSLLVLDDLVAPEDPGQRQRSRDRVLRRPRRGLPERLDDHAPVRLQAGRVKLQHDPAVVPIGDHARQPVRLPVHDPEPGRPPHQIAPERQRALHPVTPERSVDLLRALPRQDPHRDRGVRVVVATSDEALSLDHVHDGAGRERLRRLLDGLSEHPGMPGAEVTGQVLLQPKARLDRAHLATRRFGRRPVDRSPFARAKLPMTKPGRASRSATRSRRIPSAGPCPPRSRAIAM